MSRWTYTVEVTVDAPNVIAADIAAQQIIKHVAHATIVVRPSRPNPVLV